MTARHTAAALAAATAPTTPARPVYVAAEWTSSDDYTTRGTVTRQTRTSVYVLWPGASTVDRISLRHDTAIRLMTVEDLAADLDAAGVAPDFREREMWRGRTVILAADRDQLRNCPLPGATVPRYVVVDVAHSNGSALLVDSRTGRPARGGAYAHINDLVWVDANGHDLGGRFAEVAAVISLHRDTAGRLTVDTEPLAGKPAGSTAVAIVGKYGDPTTVTLDRGELATLHAALGARLAELDRPTGGALVPVDAEQDPRCCGATDAAPHLFQPGGWQRPDADGYYGYEQCNRLADDPAHTAP